MPARDDDARLQQMSAEFRSAAIAALNDQFRQRGVGGRTMLTAGVQALGQALLMQALAGVRTFDAFNGDNDPHGEHDFGSLNFGAARLFWKIDYYDRQLLYGSPDPTDPAVTTRVLTIMLAEEY
jgi:hypothetical protein